METETKTMGALLPGIADHGFEPMASPMPSTQSWPELDLSSLPKRLDDGTMAKLREIATSPLSGPASCSDDWFAKCMKSLDILPKRQDDQVGGQLKFGLYKRHLSGFSNEALSYLTMQATKTCHWFPSIAECLEILRAWPNRSRDLERREKAQHLIQREQNLRMDEAVAALGRRECDQAQIDALPDFTKRVATEKGYLWKWPDGRFTVRLDLDRLDPEARDAERARIKAMLAEWEAMTAEQEASE